MNQLFRTTGHEGFENGVSIARILEPGGGLA